MPHQEYRGLDGKKWPSATELTSLLPKSFIWEWYKRSVQKDGWAGWLKCNAASETGKRTGTLVHGYLDSFARQEPVPEPTTMEEQTAFKYAESLFQTVDPLVDEYVAIEPHLISREIEIHGSADIIVRREDKLWIGDYKTSYAKDPGHPIQLAIYALCWNEENADKIDDGFIARVDKKSKKFNVKIDDYLNLSQYYPVVRALKTLYDYTRE